jgi:hypothetical protein
VLVGFNVPHTGVRHSLRFTCHGQSSLSLLSEKEDARWQACSESRPSIETEAEGATPMSIENAQSRAPKDPEQASQELERAKDVEMHKREMLNALVGEQVLDDLGEPDGLLSVQVRPLWKERYRVNVFVGVDAASAKVAHSYFVVTDEEGNVLKTTPVIQRLSRP